MRHITIEYPKCCGPMKGVYRIQFGGKFYIGRADLLHARMRQHEKAINEAILLYGWGAIPPRLFRYLKLTQYILENDGIQVCQCRVLQRCVSSWHMHYVESYYINEFFDHPDCVNNSRYPTPPKGFHNGQDKLWDLEIGKFKEVFYFDPRNPSEKISGFAPLTSNGLVSKRKMAEIIKMAVDSKNYIL